jgi:hypothetical protein
MRLASRNVAPRSVADSSSEGEVTISVALTGVVPALARGTTGSRTGGPASGPTKTSEPSGLSSITSLYPAWTGVRVASSDHVPPSRPKIASW